MKSLKLVPILFLKYTVKYSTQASSYIKALLNHRKEHIHLKTYVKKVGGGYKNNKIRIIICKSITIKSNNGRQIARKNMQVDRNSI